MMEKLSADELYAQNTMTPDEIERLTGRPYNSPYKRSTVHTRLITTVEGEQVRIDVETPPGVRAETAKRYLEAVRRKKGWGGMVVQSAERGRR